MIPAKTKQYQFSGMTEVRLLLPQIQPVMDDKKITFADQKKSPIRRRVIGKPVVGSSATGFYVDDYFDL